MTLTADQREAVLAEIPNADIDGNRSPGREIRRLHIRARRPRTADRPGLPFGAGRADVAPEPSRHRSAACQKLAVSPAAMSSPSDARSMTT